MTSNPSSPGAGRPLPAAVMQTFRQAMAAHQAGNLNEAEMLYRRALDGDAKRFPVLLMLGVLYTQRGNYPEAERLLRKALELHHNDAGAHFNLGNVLLAQQRFDEAFSAFGKTLELNSTVAEAHLNRGSILMARKSMREAIASFDAAIRINPNYAEAHCNRGNALEALKSFDDALASCEKAVGLAPQNAEFHASRANILHQMKRFDEALNTLATALSLQPDNASFHYNRGNILFKLKRYPEAFAAYDRAFFLDPQMDYVEGDRLFAKAMICDWNNIVAESNRLVTGVSKGRLVSRPFVFLAAESSPAVQSQCANLFVDHEFPPMPALASGQRYRHDRIRIAYLSADFRDHPVAHLLAGVFEAHDRTRFETFAVSFGSNEPTPMRRRLELAFDKFMDVGNDSDAEIANMLRRAEVDIAVDLMGPTEGARPAILSYQPAPIQVMYLGYAGSSGATYMDYLIADRIVVPDREIGVFREKVVYLPETFMGTDSKRLIASNTPSRADEGLPERGFVFCAFSNTYKISPQIFDVWMQLLLEVADSVLWLSAGNEAAMENLRREAQSRGVAPERLVFARRATLNEDHLARHRLADLFLDTMPLGAHSTVCDALWAGLPVLTCTGATFGGRIASSLLSALGLEELIVDSLAKYKMRALALARDPAGLTSLKSKIIDRRSTFPLFNTERFTRHLEAGFVAMLERHQRGEPPSMLEVPLQNSDGMH